MPDVSQREKRAQDAELDRELEQTFPASDPPQVTREKKDGRRPPEETGGKRTDEGMRPEDLNAENDD